jgi:MYXO-CTERM domain-containing protein
MVCTANTDCTTAGDVCVGGHCVPGPSMPGGLGSPCTGNADCASGQCASDGKGHEYCVEACDPAMAQCPSGFSCQATSTGATSGVCWPGAEHGGGGCSAGSGAGAPLLFVLGLAGMLITRRRR